MHLETMQYGIQIPEGVTITVSGRTITVKGEKGELSRYVAMKRVALAVENKEFVVQAKNVTKREKAIIKTTLAHVRNMVRGVQEEHMYKLKICSGHFPMTVTLKDGVLEVKNFIGESVPRRLKIMDNVNVEVKGTDITVKAVSKELAGNQAGAIELLTRRPGFDPRIFQDGIYITEKDGKEV